MNKISTQYFPSKFGDLLIGVFEDKLCLCDWQYRRMRTSIDQRIQKSLKAEFVEENNSIIEKTKQQLQEYFLGERTTFDIPLCLVGTDFQKSVWEALLKIPYGTTESYLGLSQKLGNEKAIRAVASANGANAISIIIPCHRIIGSKGELTGYAGGIATKKRLLQLEKIDLYQNQLELF